MLRSCEFDAETREHASERDSRASEHCKLKRVKA